jgi:hypothetical protein
MAVTASKPKTVSASIIFHRTFFWAGDHLASVESGVTNESHIRATAARPEQDDLVSLRLAALHTGGADRHAGHRKAGRVRLVGKKTLERDGWNVSFNDIPRNFRRVARREIVRNAEPCLHRIEVYAVVKGIAVRSPRLAPALGHS